VRESSDTSRFFAKPLPALGARARTRPAFPASFAILHHFRVLWRHVSFQCSLCELNLTKLDRTVCDPSLLETQLCTGTLTLTLNAQNEICVFTKAGGEPLSVKEIMRIVGIAKQKVKDIELVVKRALDKEKAKMQAQMSY
jgi:hypothetical protein